MMESLRSLKQRLDDLETREDGYMTQSVDYVLRKPKQY